MNWQAANLITEWRRFRQHCDVTFKGPLDTKPEGRKVNYLTTYIGDKGRETYETFSWTPETGDTQRRTHSGGGYVKYVRYTQYDAPIKTASVGR